MRFLSLLTCFLEESGSPKPASRSQACEGCGLILRLGLPHLFTSCLACLMDEVSDSPLASRELFDWMVGAVFSLAYYFLVGCLFSLATFLLTHHYLREFPKLDQSLWSLSLFISPSLFFSLLFSFSSSLPLSLPLSDMEVSYPF